MKMGSKLVSSWLVPLALIGSALVTSACVHHTNPVRTAAADGPWTDVYVSDCDHTTSHRHHHVVERMTAMQDGCETALIDRYEYDASGELARMERYWRRCGVKTISTTYECTDLECTTTKRVDYDKDGSFDTIRHDIGTVPLGQVASLP